MEKVRTIIQKSALLLLIVFLSACTSTKQTSRVHDSSQSTIITEAYDAYAKENYEEAITLFSQALSVSDNHPAILNGLGISYLQCEQYSQAEKILKHAVDQVPTSAELWANYASALFYQKKYQQAEQAFKTAINISPMLNNAINGIASLYIVNDEASKAIKLLHDQSQNAPDDSIVKLNYAFALSEVGLHNDAIQILEAYTALQQNDAKAYNLLATVLLEAKKVDEAKIAIDKAIALSPIESTFHYNKGNILKEDNDFEEAKDSYNRALAFNPEMVEAYINRGDLNYLLKDYVAACTDLKTASDKGFGERLKLYKELGRCTGPIWN